MKFLASLLLALACAAPLNAQTAMEELSSPTSVAEPSAHRNQFVIALPPSTLFASVSPLGGEATKQAIVETCFGKCVDVEELDGVPFALDKQSFAHDWFQLKDAGASYMDADPAMNGAPDIAKGNSEGFRWRPALRQSFLILAVQHGYAMTQPKTREALQGKFFHDYIASVKSLRGWGDGGKFFTNYIAHPMQGSLTGFIQIQNDPRGMRQRFGTSGDYWRSRMKALAWSAAWSTQFEIGLISQASIGNVGASGKQTWVDIVVTPTIGTGLLITEDALDRFVIEGIERNVNNFYIRAGSRMVLNPTRTLANLFRFKKPWHRDRPRAD